MKSMYTKKEFRDQLKEAPVFKTKDGYLDEILKFATDKRCHVLLVDCNAWLEGKMMVIAHLAKEAKKLKN